MRRATWETRRQSPSGLPTDSNIPDHDAFVAGLKDKHGRKYGSGTLTTGTERVAR